MFVPAPVPAPSVPVPFSGTVRTPVDWSLPLQVRRTPLVEHVILGYVGAEPVLMQMRASGVHAAVACD